MNSESSECALTQSAARAARATKVICHEQRTADGATTNCVVIHFASGEDARAFFVVDTFAENIVDAVGAGDALLAYATLSMVATGNTVIASILGSIAAAVECEHDGNVPVEPRDVLQRIAAVERHANLT